MSATTAEGLLVGLLAGALPGVPVAGDVPADRPEVLVTVERVGGAVDRFVSRGVFAIQAWAPTRAKAAGLAERVASAVLDLPTRSGRVAGSNVVSVVNLPDPDSGHPRYQVTATVTTTV